METVNAIEFVNLEESEIDVAHLGSKIYTS